MLFLPATSHAIFECKTGQPIFAHNNSGNFCMQQVRQCLPVKRVKQFLPIASQAIFACNKSGNFASKTGEAKVGHCQNVSRGFPASPAPSLMGNQSWTFPKRVPRFPGIPGLLVNRKPKFDTPKLCPTACRHPRPPRE